MDLQRFLFVWFGLVLVLGVGGVFLALESAKLTKLQQPWPWIVFALADVFIQMNIKSSFSFGLPLFFPPLLTPLPPKEQLLHSVVRLFFLTKIR